MALPTYIAFATLLSDLRVNIHDVDAKSASFRFRTTNGEVTSLVLSISATTLAAVATGGSQANLSVTLTGKTARQVVSEINAVAGYQADLDPQASWEHDATDFRQTPSGGINIAQQDFVIQHHAFSDAELTRILTRAMHTHNPGFTTSTIPEREAEAVLLLAHIMVCKVFVHENAKFYAIEGQVASGNKGERVDHYLRLASAMRNEYDAIVDRLGLRPDTDLDGDSESGAIHVGSMRRARPRYGGARIPVGMNTRPQTPNGFAVSNTSVLVEDDTDEMHLTWERIRSNAFSHVIIVRQKTASTMLVDNYRAMVDRFSGEADFAIVCTLYDVRKTWFTDSGLDAATTYYYRLFVFDRNGEWACSSIVSAATAA